MAVFRGLGRRISQGFCFTSELRFGDKQARYDTDGSTDDSENVNPKPIISMKQMPLKVFSSTRFSGILLAAFLLLSATKAKCDINEARVLRDASGVYKGLVTGGTFTVTYDAGVPAPFSFTGPTVDFKELARFKDGRSGATITDDDLTGDGAGTGAATQNARVTRGGKRIILKVTKILFEEDETDNKGPWTDGQANGNVDDKGARWFASSTSSASQRNSSVLGGPVDHTRRVTGRRISGKG